MLHGLDRLSIYYREKEEGKGRKGKEEKIR